MRQEQFVERYRKEWQDFEDWLRERGELAIAKRSGRPWAGLRDEEIPARYRRLCQQLALARRRGYSPSVTTRLQDLMQRGHAVMYRAPPARLRAMLDFILAGFPRLVRAHGRFMLASFVLFALPLAICFVLAQQRPDMVFSILGPEQVAQMESMYDPTDPRHAEAREASTNLQMFGFYVWNNVSIGFRTFASGLVLAVGTVITLLMNGITIGTVAGHLQQVGSGTPFWRFVAGHSAAELTAIVIAGGAGLRIGMALVAPGRRRRVDALVDAGRDGARLAMGFFAMLVLAAVIEAFWSSNGAIPAPIKYAVGIAMWALVLGWLFLGGRRGGAHAG